MADQVLSGGSIKTTLGAAALAFAVAGHSWMAVGPTPASGDEIVDTGNGAVVFVLPTPDPAKIVGAMECGECHEKEVETWKDTAHFTGGLSLPRSPEAKRIAKALGIRRIKVAGQCITCHYTPEEEPDGRVKASQGVSCESCHGAAKDWIEIHDKYGGPELTRETETVDHRDERHAKCDRAGMHRPGPLYNLAAACWTCHTTPSEELVNDAGHPLCDDFELVSWSQGKIRHNFFRGPNGTNVESAPERKRVMYLLGQTLELEDALRRLAAATEPGPYQDHVRTRAVKAYTTVEAIDAIDSFPRVGRALDATRDGVETSEQRRAILAAAAEVQTAAKAIAANRTGQDMAAIDALLASSAKTPAVSAPPAHGVEE